MDVVGVPKLLDDMEENAFTSVTVAVDVGMSIAVAVVKLSIAASGVKLSIAVSGVKLSVAVAGVNLSDAGNVAAKLLLFIVEYKLSKKGREGFNFKPD